MEIIVDECLAKSTIQCLLEAGFNPLSIEDVLNSGVDDETIFEYATNKNLPVITHDRGFGILFHFSQGNTPTIIVLQVLSPHPEATNYLLKESLSKIDLNQPKYNRKLIIFSKNAIRIRPE